MFSPKDGWRGFVLHVFQQTWFKNSWMHLVVCSYPLFFRYSGTAKKPPQQETKLEKGCIQSLGENLCSFQENHLSIVLQTEKIGCFSGQDSQELAAPLGSLFSRC